MNCYLCSNSSHSKIQDRVRDRDDISVLKCRSCGLVFLDKKDHIDESFYEQGGMGKSFKLDNITSATDYSDTQKRFKLYNKFFSKKRILDFGCGQGSLLRKIKMSGIPAELFALEPNKNHQKTLKKEFTVYSCIDEIPDESLDVITLFHVLEHIEDPVSVLNLLYPKLAKKGKLIIEVPSSNDALLHLYGCEAFAEFTYWSCHLYLFDPETLRALLEKTVFKINCIKQYQRYSLANHLHWLAKAKPAGHIEWSFMDDEILQAQYEKKLAEIGQCDSLVAIVEK